MRKFYLLGLLFFSIFALFSGLRAYSKSSLVPRPDSPTQFYSPQTGDHLQSVLLKGIKQAKCSIWIRIYGMTDERVIQLINSKADDGINVEITYDSKASKSLKKRLSEKIKATPYQGKGIGHQKLCIIDDQYVWCGSTNFTGKSLLMHENLLIGLYHPQLALHLKSKYPLPFHSDTLDFYIVSPDCLDKVIYHIDQAKNSLKIAMFTWTHQDLLEAVLRAKKRGVAIEIVLDPSVVSGSGKAIAKKLQEDEIPLHVQKGLALMHHKFLWVDESILITGSANWTKAAFNKNDEHLLIYPLQNKNEISYFQTFWKHLWNDTFPL